MPTRKDAWSPIRWAKRVRPMLRENGRVYREAHHVLLVLATYAKSDGSDARPGLSTLADETYLTERATLDALEHIQAAGLISKSADLNGTTVWQLHLHIVPTGSTLLDERRERARAANAKRQQEYRRRKQSNAVADRDGNASPERDGNAVVDRHVTPSDSVSHAVVERDVTPSSPSQQQVTPVVTALSELPLNCPIPTTATEKPDRDAQFAEFWSAYPRKVSKGGARKKWDAVVDKSGVDPGVILAGAQRYAAERAADRRPNAEQFTKHPTTWLNNQCWEDAPQLGLLRAVGDYQPYRGPRDLSAYDEEF